MPRMEPNLVAIVLFLVVLYIFIDWCRWYINENGGGFNWRK